jgi:hypothetical protein
VSAGPIGLELNLSREAQNVAGTGTLSIDVLNQLIDGTFVAQYSFSLDSGTGGKITGSGLGKWA